MLRKKLGIKVKLETVKGTKVAGDQALTVFDLNIKPTSPFEQRRGSGRYMGNNNTGVLGESSGMCSFTAEVRGNGTTGVEAGLAILLQACNFLKTSESYTPCDAETNQKTISIDVWEGDLKKGLAGAMGKVSFEGVTGQRLLVKFEFEGIWQAPVDEAMPAIAPSTTAPMLLKGGTFSIGGNNVKIGNFGLDMGNALVQRQDVNASGGIAHYLITDIDPVVTCDPEAELVASYDWYGIWLAGTEAALSLVVTDGTTTITFTIPKIQHREIDEGDRDGIAINQITAQCNNDSGNDSVTISAA